MPQNTLSQVCSINRSCSQKLANQVIFTSSFAFQSPLFLFHSSCSVVFTRTLELRTRGPALISSASQINARPFLLSAPHTGINWFGGFSVCNHECFAMNDRLHFTLFDLHANSVIVALTAINRRTGWRRTCSSDCAVTRHFVAHLTIPNDWSLCGSRPIVYC